MVEGLQPAVSARLAHLILALTRARGGDAEALARDVGFDPAQPLTADSRVPLEMEERMWSEAARRTGDPLFGLHGGMRYQPGAFDVFDYVCRSANNLRGAIERVVRYNRLLHDVAEFTLTESGDRAVIAHRFRAGIPGPVPQAADFTAASCLAAARLWTGMQIRARRVALPRPPPDDPAAYEAHFGTKRIDYGAPNIELELDRPHLDLPLAAADPGLCIVLERHADHILDSLPQLGGFESRFRELLAAELRGGTPTADAIAARLHMSARTLARRLADAGTSFGDELEALRKALAMRYLEDRRVSIGEVAFLLGYSEPRAFHRAFKAWTGQTPGSWRDHQSSA